MDAPAYTKAACTRRLARTRSATNKQSSDLLTYTDEPPCPKDASAVSVSSYISSNAPIITTTLPQSFHCNLWPQCVRVSQMRSDLARSDPCQTHVALKFNAAARPSAFRVGVLNSRYSDLPDMAKRRSERNSKRKHESIFTQRPATTASMISGVFSNCHLCYSRCSWATSCSQGCYRYNATFHAYSRSWHDSWQECCICRTCRHYITCHSPLLHRQGGWLYPDKL